MYLGNPCTEKVRTAMRDGLIGMMATPSQGNPIEPGFAWAADNGCFGKGYPGDEMYLTWLATGPRRVNRDRCLFATAPDVLFDAAGTLARAAPVLPRIRALGYQAALVGQNGLESLDVPWLTFDVLFIGGDTAWKLGPSVVDLLHEARAQGKKTHVGRVNSRKRYRMFAALDVDSVDGTYLRFGPDVNLPKLLAWVDAP